MCLGYVPNGLPDTSTTRHFGVKTLWDTSAPISRQFEFDTKNVVAYETFRHECRDRGKAGTLQPRTISMRHSSTGDSAKTSAPILWCRSDCGRSAQFPRMTWSTTLSVNRLPTFCHEVFVNYCKQNLHAICRQGHSESTATEFRRIAEISANLSIIKFSGHYLMVNREAKFENV